MEQLLNQQEERNQQVDTLLGINEGVSAEIKSGGSRNKNER
ncbi:hypothetical protein EMIT0210MI2_250160 [Priestia megaterium]|nr:hypothetical protein [Priestia megaterium]